MSRGAHAANPDRSVEHTSRSVFDGAVRRRNRPPSPEGRCENSPPFQGWGCGSGSSRPEGTAESNRRIRPSLRDLGNSLLGPGSELPGYFQISLREKGSVGPKCPNSRPKAAPWAIIFRL